MYYVSYVAFKTETQKQLQLARLMLIYRVDFIFIRNKRCKLLEHTPTYTYHTHAHICPLIETNNQKSADVEIIF